MPNSVTFNTVAAIARERGLLGRAQAALDMQVIKDSNFFCPEDEGTLQASAITSSLVGKGLVSWSTPYARAQYYGFPHKSKDKNPNAQMKWFEAAKAGRITEWIALAVKEAGGA